MELQKAKSALESLHLDYPGLISDDKAYAAEISRNKIERELSRLKLERSRIKLGYVSSKDVMML